MHYRPFGDTGISVSEIGPGSWQLGSPAWSGPDGADATRVIQPALIPDGVTMSHAAPQFILARPKIPTAIPRAGNAEQVRNNAATAGRREPQEVVDAIRAFWERELKDDPLAW